MNWLVQWTLFLVQSLSLRKLLFVIGIHPYMCAGVCVCVCVCTYVCMDVSIYVYV